MNCKIIVIGILCLIVSISPILGQSNDQLDSLFNRWEESNEKLPGLGVAIIKDGQVVYKKAHGYANLEYDIPLTTSSVFDMASLAKQFTGLAVAQLIVKGRLDMEDSVREYLPSLGEVFDDIKIKHLVYHSSGLRDIGGLFGLGNYGCQLNAQITLRIMEEQQGLNFKTGKESDYSNSNYVLLALIVEKISGSTFRKYCQDHIFSPLGMKNSFVNDNITELIEHRAVAYYMNEGKVDFLQENGMYLIGSSAVYSTIDDMILWARAIQSENQFTEEIKLMKRKGALDNGKEIGYGFGLGIGEVNGMGQIGHTGATPSGFRSEITWIPSERLSLVLLSSWGNIDLSGEFAKPIIDWFSSSINKVDDPVEDVESITTVQLSMTEANKFVGKYLFNEQMKVEITNVGGLLKVQPEGQPALDLIALNDSTLNFPAFRSTLHFSKVNGYRDAEIFQGDNKAGGLRRTQQRDAIAFPLSLYVGRYYSSELDQLFDILKKDETLFIRSLKHGDIGLNETALDVFRVGGGIDAVIRFERSKDGADQFYISRGSRLRDLKLIKMKASN